MALHSRRPRYLGSPVSNLILPSEKCLDASPTFNKFLPAGLLLQPESLRSLNANPEFVRSPLFVGILSQYKLRRDLDSSLVPMACKYTIRHQDLFRHRHKLLFRSRRFRTTSCTSDRFQ